jgi:hypothetical protein
LALAVVALAVRALAADEGVDRAGGTRGFDHVEFRVDPNVEYLAHVDVFPGEEGAEICATDRGDGHVDFGVESATDEATGERGNGHVDFRIVVRPDGVVEVNGQVLAVSDPAAGCRISLAWSPGSGTIGVQATDATGGRRAGQYALATAPEVVQITAAEVRYLSVVRG